ncbi:hypothetical protein C8J56DRAFT_1087504 [Mycena floridula]|nr:hypothetical protein C8J56DRAFT_1087504 [Mycena floridula]
MATCYAKPQILRLLLFLCQLRMWGLQLLCHCSIVTTNVSLRTVEPSPLAKPPQPILIPSSNSSAGVKPPDKFILDPDTWLFPSQAAAITEELWKSLEITNGAWMSGHIKTDGIPIFKFHSIGQLDVQKMMRHGPQYLVEAEPKPADLEVPKVVTIEWKPKPKPRPVPARKPMIGLETFHPFFLAFLVQMTVFPEYIQGKQQPRKEFQLV